MTYLGNICFTPINAKLTLDVSWWGWTQSPYIKVRLDGQKKKTGASYKSGLKPHWKDESLVLDFYSNSGKVQVDCLDYSKFGRGTYIGIGYIDVHDVQLQYNPLVKNGQVCGQQNVAIYKENSEEFSGSVLLHWKFIIDFDIAISLKDTTHTNDTKKHSLDTYNNSQKKSTKIDIINNQKLTLPDQQKSEQKCNLFGKEPVDLNIGKLIGRQYQLIKKLGSGEFGDVYLAQDDAQNLYAVKRITKERIKKNRVLSGYLKDEVAIMKKVDHPNIIKLHAFIETNSSYYIVMQYCDNGDVEQYMAKREITFFKEEEAIFFLKQISMGFRELHKHKVIHRDLKLTNLFIHGSTIYIADFGFAKSNIDSAKSMQGSPAYMAPEIMSGEAYTNLTDLWAIGITLFEILFGYVPFQTPYESKNASGKNLKIPHEINPVSKLCVDLLQKILEYDVKERMSWEQFFNHPIFKTDQDISTSGVDGPLGSSVEMYTEINNRFENYKCEPASPENDSHQILYNICNGLQLGQGRNDIFHDFF